MRILVWLLLLCVLFGLGLIVFVPNLNPVELHYYFGTLEAPLAILLVAGIAVGALLGVLFNALWAFRLRYDNRRMRKLLREAERELALLRLNKTGEHNPNGG